MSVVVTRLVLEDVMMSDELDTALVNEELGSGVVDMLVLEDVVGTVDSQLGSGD